MQPETGPTNSLAASARPIEPMRLEAISGPGASAVATLSAGSLIIGSSRSAGLVLLDPSVSRQHAEVTLIPGGVRVKDLESRNGVHYLGARVASADLPPGANVTLGKTVVRVAPVVVRMQSDRLELAGLVARSVAMRELLWHVERVAQGDTTVSISGPTGAGKDVVARAIHSLSKRAEHPLLVFDCASAKGELLESDLFGHVKGSFTGADAARTGVVEAAHQGTLVLDHVDHLELGLQTRLLRFLETRTVRRLGASHEREVDVRVIALSQQPLERGVAEQRLRSDLFYRLTEVVLEVPPLSRRLEDIAELATRFAAESGANVELSTSTIAALQAQAWPGNARELRNAVSRALTFGHVPPRTPDDEPGFEPEVDLKATRAQMVSGFEADFLRSLMLRNKGNVSAAAREARIARSHFYTMLRRHNLIGAGR